MAIYGVHQRALKMEGRQLHRGHAVTVVVLITALVALPLVVTSVRVVQQERDSHRVADVARTWAEAAGWRLVAVEPGGDGYRGGFAVRVAGAAPGPDPADLEASLDAEGLGGQDVTVYLDPEDRVEIGGSGSATAPPG
jgi:hypothetical protein